MVVVHAMSALVDFFHVCDALYKFCKKPTTAAHCKSVHLKRLLEQRWTGHLTTVSVILKSFNDLTLLTETDTVESLAQKYGWAMGLLREMTKPSFLFIANLVHTVLALLDPPNKLL